jgi:hypothetical protein
MKNPQAFPPDEFRGIQIDECSTKILRDWFAGQVLSGYTEVTISYEEWAKECYDMAEAMLKEREKRNEK